jgi:hypothetical protein
MSVKWALCYMDDGVVMVNENSRSIMFPIQEFTRMFS